MKAYNTPQDELHIESNDGESLVSITPEGTTIKNFAGVTSADAGKILGVNESGEIVAENDTSVFNLDTDLYVETTVQDLLSLVSGPTPITNLEVHNWVDGKKYSRALIKVTGALGGYILYPISYANETNTNSIFSMSSYISLFEFFFILTLELTHSGDDTVGTIYGKKL